MAMICAAPPQCWRHCSGIPDQQGSVLHCVLLKIPVSMEFAMERAHRKGQRDDWRFGPEPASEQSPLDGMSSAYPICSRAFASKDYAQALPWAQLDFPVRIVSSVQGRGCSYLERAATGTNVCSVFSDALGSLGRPDVVHEYEPWPGC
jgi:hypothetical protein